MPKRENIEWAKFPSSLNQFKRNKHIQDIDRPEREHGNKKKKASNSYLPCYSPSYTSYAFYRGSYIFVLFSSVICSGNNFFTNFYSMQFSLCICNFFESLRSPLPFLLIAMNGHFLVFSFFHSKRRAQNYWSNYPLDWSGMQRMQTFVFAWMVCWIQCTRTFWVAKTNVSNNKVNASFTSTNIHTHTHTFTRWCIPGSSTTERFAPCVMNMKKVAYTGTKRTLKIFTNFFLFLSIFVQTLHQHIYFILRFIKNYVAQFVLHKSLSESM